MSIKSEREKVLSFEFIAEYPEYVAALDRVILEAKAEMDCYRAWWDDDLSGACGTALTRNPERWCPSCTAKAELEVMKVTT